MIQGKATADSTTDRAAVRPDVAKPAILMVDDQPAKLLSYEAILSGLDVRCDRALSGTEALQKLLHTDYAAVLLDVRMPDMDGFEVARLMRESSRLRHVPIVFVTGIDVSEFERLRGYEVGAVDYLSVPVIAEVLRSKVALLVELHQRRAELSALNKSIAVAHHARESRAQPESAQSYFEKLFEHPTQLCLVLKAVRDESGRISDWISENANSNLIQLLGRTRPDFVHRRIAECLPPQCHEDAPLYAQVLEGQQTAQYERKYGDKQFLCVAFPVGPDLIAINASEITSVKQTEAALRTSQSRFHALIENAPVAVVLHSLDGHFEYSNKAYCRLVDYTDAELRTRTWRDITHPEDVDSQTELAQRVLRGEIEHYVLEKRLVRKDGGIVWVSFFGNFLFDDARQPVQGLGVAVDITARKRAEDALRESRQRLLLANKAAGIGIFDRDLRSGELSWDEQTRRMWRTHPEEPVTYDRFISRIHPEDRPGLELAVKAALAPTSDGLYSATYRLVHPGDVPVQWIESVAQVTFADGVPVRMLGTVRDVTERKLASEKLEASEEKFRELANNIDQITWTCDETGRATWQNRRWAEYSGLGEQQSLDDGWRKAVHPDHLERILVTLRKSTMAGLTWEETFPIRNASGSYRWFLSRAVPIRSGDGAVVKWFGTSTDITELRDLHEALRDADRRKDEFLAMLAHELRNPVAPIASAAAAMARIPGENSQKALSEIIGRQTGVLSRLLDDLLDVARVTQSRIELRQEVLPLRLCVDLAVEMAAPRINEKKHDLSVTGDFGGLYVDADRIRITQCIANVLVNAAQYTENGGRIEVSVRREDGRAMLDVRDNGAGIAADDLPFVFNVFRQGRRSIDRAQGGLGIGLAVCKRLIEMHGGNVAASSDGLGKGSLFTIALPVVEPPSIQSTDPIAEKRRELDILVVDDNRDAADSLAMLLGLEGHRVRTAYSGIAALEALRESAADFVLLDLGMPQMDGYETARRIRSNKDPVRIVALSGYGQLSDRASTGRIGFDGHLVKPVDINDLQDLLTRLTASRDFNR